LLILARRASRGDETIRKQAYKLYLAHMRYVNNWDLVDVSVPDIVGGYLVDKSRALLDQLAASQSLWER
jgi:3-methyladenine DNA glycosylase AlkD